MKKSIRLWSIAFALCAFVLTSCSGTSSVDGHEAVDLGLSVKWAATNVGASTPDSKGDYFAWGETQSKTLFTARNCQSAFRELSEIQGRTDYDAATKEWGKNWRIPTKREIQELVDKCTWTWSQEGEWEGYRVTGPNGNSIFLPAGGFSFDGTVHYKNSAGVYWSGTVAYGNQAYIIAFGDNGNHQVAPTSYYFGGTIRPVTDK